MQQRAAFERNHRILWAVEQVDRHCSQQADLRVRIPGCAASRAEGRDGGDWAACAKTMKGKPQHPTPAKAEAGQEKPFWIEAVSKL